MYNKQEYKMGYRALLRLCGVCPMRGMYHAEAI